ncbi:cholinesterase 1-like [Patiria miniata]|uniref:Carboxylic ester hydrolase n=1 Tax=Patiria miniata TaxID=46514 RepID=A0A914AE98_PATMI|nr:cholinesterase 1-like [Patiria miniata]
MGSNCLRLQVVLSLGLLMALTAAQDQPTVTVEQGDLFGTTEIFQESEFLKVNKTIDVFKGIPFAEPPVGTLRFKPPVAKQPWEITYNATYFRDACVQIDSAFVGSHPRSEDCLHLNIWAPRPGVQGGAAVMVWIHGGAHMGGTATSNQYDGVALAAFGDVIVVSMNYRVNVFGFLYTGDEGAPGNVGLRDHILGLKWIKNNIAAFGGDSERITIFGESAGSASVSFLLLSKEAEGLFSNAIMESGTVFAPWPFTEDKDRLRRYSFDIGEKVGCTAEESAALLDCLRTKDSLAVFNAATSISSNTPHVVVDGTFLDDTPANLYAKGEYIHAKLLMGSTRDEGTVFTFINPLFQPYMINSTSDEIPILPRDIVVQAISEEVVNLFGGANDQLVAAIEQHYVDWSQADKEDANYFWTFVGYSTDGQFACGTDRVARYHAQGDDDVFMYQMRRRDVLYSTLGDLFPSWLGATHGADIWFVFGHPFLPENRPFYGSMFDDDKALSVKFMEFWTSFAKTGTPDASGVWPKFTVPELEYIGLDVNLTTGRALKSEECHFWNVIADKLRTLPRGSCTSDLWRETSKGRYSCVIEEDLCDALDCKDETPQTCAAGGVFAMKLLMAAVAFVSLIVAKQ